MRRSTGLAVVVSFALLLALAAPAAADWPIYGRDLSNTRNAGHDGPPVKDVGTLKETWRFDAPTDFTGTPVVADGLVVAGSYDGIVYAVDAVTGKLRWKRNLAQPINGSAAIDMNASGGPTVYMPLAQEGSPKVAALFLKDGKPRWTQVLTNQPTSSVYGSAAIWKGNVYIGTSGPNGDNANARGTVVSLDGATGDINWRTYTVPTGSDGGPVWATPAIDTQSGKLFVGTGNAYHGTAAGTTDAILALNSVNGAIDGHYQAVAADSFAADNPAGPDADFGSSPNLMRGPKGEAWVGEGGKDGNYYTLDRETMKLAWTGNNGPGSALGAFVGSTVYDGTRVYGENAVTSQVAAINPDGSTKWTSPDGGSADFSPLAMANGVLYTVNQPGFITARDGVTGAVLNKFSLGGGTFGGMSTTGRALYVAMGMGPPPPPAPQQANPGSIVAFGDTSHSGAPGTNGHGGPGPGGGTGNGKRRHIRLRVKPRHAVAGRRTAFRFRAYIGSKPTAGVVIRFAGHRARTKKNGRARIVARLHRGRHRARGTKAGMTRGSVRVYVRRR